MNAGECREEAARIRLVIRCLVIDGHAGLARQLAMIADQYEDLAEYLDAPNAVLEDAA